MKIITGAFMAVLGLGFMLLYAVKPLRVQTYLLPSTLKPSWVIIEYDNQKCPALKEGRLWQEHTIPESGYLCTSSHSEEGLTYQRYYLVDEKGGRTRLAINDQIFQRRTIYLNPLNGTCKVTAEEFWYGPKDQITTEDTALLENHHPECRKGLETTIK